MSVVKDKTMSLYDHPTVIIKSTVACIKALHTQVQLWLSHNWIEHYEYLGQDQLKAKHAEWDALALIIQAEWLAICDNEVRDQQKRIKQLQQQ